jgi:hypothetical protein
VLDHLVECPEDWPESWKKDNQRNTTYVYFWDDIFERPLFGNLYVRYGSWRGGKVVSGCFCLDNRLFGIDRAASKL